MLFERKDLISRESNPSAFANSSVFLPLLSSQEGDRGIERCQTPVLLRPRRPLALPPPPRGPPPRRPVPAAGTGTRSATSRGTETAPAPAALGQTGRRPPDPPPTGDPSGREIPARGGGTTPVGTGATGPATRPPRHRPAWEGRRGPRPGTGGPGTVPPCTCPTSR